jgi:hypothetical protein
VDNVNSQGFNVSLAVRRASFCLKVVEAKKAEAPKERDQESC